jgi:hypothetical protein
VVWWGGRNSSANRYVAAAATPAASTAPGRSTKLCGVCWATLMPARYAPAAAFSRRKVEDGEITLRGETVLVCRLHDHNRTLPNRGTHRA